MRKREKDRLLEIMDTLSDGIEEVRRLMENAILSSASAVILAHNHPSGVALPSEADHAATLRVKMALEAVDVRLEDHIVVADHDFISFSESGFLS